MARRFAVKDVVYRIPFSFIPTSEEGQALKEGKWGNLDGSLSFIDKPVEIISSSNGFLLCLTTVLDYPKDVMGFPVEGEGRNYFICNPVTRQFRQLPRTHKPAQVAHPVFICKGDNVLSLDDVYFEVVRAAVPQDGQSTTTLEIETFSSLTNQWSGVTMVSSDSPFLMNSEFKYQAGFVIDEVIFWNAELYDAMDEYGFALLAYDRSASATCVKVIKGPAGQDGSKFQGMSDWFGPSEGKVHFGRHDKVNLEVWVLEEFKRRTNWVRKYVVSLNEIIKEVPKCHGISFLIHDVSFPAMVRCVVQNFHPKDSRLVFLTLRDSAFWYDMESRQKKENIEYFSASTASGYFLYEWPLAPSDD